MNRLHLTSGSITEVVRALRSRTGDPAEVRHAVADIVDAVRTGGDDALARLTARLYGARMESPDIRAGMALLIASLCAEGTSRIGNVGQIDRGYERIDERLRALGARIERVDG